MISDWRELTKKSSAAFLKQSGNVSDVIDICKPLESLQVNGFFYGEFCNQSRSCLIGNHPKWLNFQMKNIDSHPTYSGNSFNYLKKQEIHFLSSFGNGKPVTDLHAHQVKSMLYLLWNFPDQKRSEMYGFCLDLDASEGDQKLLNNLRELERFALYFKEKALTIINNCRLPDSLLKVSTPSSLKEKPIKLDLPALKRYHLGVGYEDAYLTKKQFEVIKWMLRGATSKEIAELLTISSRTVEKHIENIRINFNCSSKQALLNLILNSNLFYLIFD